MTDWLTYVQNILQTSFVGTSDGAAPGICLQCLCHNPALSKCCGSAIAEHVFTYLIKAIQP